MQDGSAKDKPVVSLAVDAALLSAAAERSLDLGRVLERALRQELSVENAASTAQDWRRENAAAIASWNEEVESEGLWSDELRTF